MNFQFFFQVKFKRNIVGAFRVNETFPKTQISSQFHLKIERTNSKTEMQLIFPHA